MPDGHRTAERRSLAMHRAIANALTDQQLAHARAKVDGWRADGSVHPQWANAWAELLLQPRELVAAELGRDDPTMTQLRQTTPFAGVLPNETRWRILREVH